MIAVNILNSTLGAVTGKKNNYFLGPRGNSGKYTVDSSFCAHLSICYQMKLQAS